MVENVPSMTIDRFKKLSEAPKKKYRVKKTKGIQAKL